MPTGTANRVAAIVQIYAHASTFPCRIVTGSDEQWVMKLRGSGPGPVALLTEFLALRTARIMGLAVPATKPLFLAPDFPWTIGTDEFDGIVQRSGGWNLGIGYFENAVPARQDEIFSASPQFLDALADADRLFCNMDRSISNPNILSSRGALYAIDFDACLFVRRAAQARYPLAFALPDGHFLSERSPPSGLDQLDPDSISEALHEAPDAWIAATHLDFGELERRLRSYIAAWNTR